VSINLRHSGDVRTAGHRRRPRSPCLSAMLVAVATTAATTSADIRLFRLARCFLGDVGGRRSTPPFCWLLLMVLLARPVISRSVDDTEMPSTITKDHYHGELSDFGDADELDGIPWVYFRGGGNMSISGCHRDSDNLNPNSKT